jgi:hypothetical protein
MELLFLCAEWHTLAKLRMHTECTLTLLENVTVDLASQFRRFKFETCDAIRTVELDSELESRMRSEARSNAKKDNMVSSAGPSTTSSTSITPPSSGQLTNAAGVVGTAGGASESEAEPSSSLRPPAHLPLSSETAATVLSVSDGDIEGSTNAAAPPFDFPHASAPGSKRRKKKVFNLNTIKYHVLWDYPDSIRRFGTCDSFTSEIVRFPTFEFIACPHAIFLSGGVCTPETQGLVPTHR